MMATGHSTDRRMVATDGGAVFGAKEFLKPVTNASTDTTQAPYLSAPKGPRKYG
ncbi:Uncharacterised protein [Mycobacteroides abscessus subsp. abscessus]|nr:Uncharacterised protein [Mycobacteroides abscessus subsp. abscessus]